MQRNPGLKNQKKEEEIKFKVYHNIFFSYYKSRFGYFNCFQIVGYCHIEFKFDLNFMFSFSIFLKYVFCFFYIYLLGIVLIVLWGFVDLYMLFLVAILMCFLNIWSLTDISASVWAYPSFFILNAVATVAESVFSLCWLSVSLWVFLRASLWLICFQFYSASR